MAMRVRFAEERPPPPEPSRLAESIFAAIAALAGLLLVLVMLRAAAPALAPILLALKP